MFRLKYSLSINLNQIEGIQEPKWKKKKLKTQRISKAQLNKISTNLPAREKFAWLQSPISVTLLV